MQLQAVGLEASFATAAASDRDCLLGARASWERQPHQVLELECVDWAGLRRAALPRKQLVPQPFFTMLRQFENDGALAAPIIQPLGLAIITSGVRQ